MPDKFIYKKTDWKSWFPEEQYSNENDMTTWTKGESVYSGIVNTGKNKKLKLKKEYWTPGNYILEASTKDKYGEEVKDVRYFTVFDIKEKHLRLRRPGRFNQLLQVVSREKKRFISLAQAEKT